MKRLIALLGLAALVAVGVPATAGPSVGGNSSDNVEFIQFIPFEASTTTGARVEGNYLFITSWKSFSIYDIKDPLNPVRLSTTPFASDGTQGGDGFRFENEDVATNGKLLIFSEELPRSALYVYDIEDKENPSLISLSMGLGQHTMSCLLDCKWLYGSDGYIIDLRNPAKPVLAKEKWGDGMPASGGHDVNEVAPGIVLTATDPMLLLDARKDPRHPKLLAAANPMGEFIHSVQWPNLGTDKFAITSGETWVPGTDARCKPTSAGIGSWDTTNWKKTHTMKLVDVWRPTNGTGVDGSPPINAPFGCSSHWFQQHPDFKNGGLVAAGFYNHGTRFLRIAKNGKISSEGWFVPHAGGTSGAYWITDRVVYAIDYQRGFDVLQYNGKL
ncbi:MAG: hypothetical protein QOK47_496 [Actinomycetota bacterium]|nr:hypothetical protein [Actinomycetota bacterium]